MINGIERNLQTIKALFSGYDRPIKSGINDDIPNDAYVVRLNGKYEYFLDEDDAIGFLEHYRGLRGYRADGVNHYYFDKMELTEEEKNEIKHQLEHRMSRNWKVDCVIQDMFQREFLTEEDYNKALKKNYTSYELNRLEEDYDRIKHPYTDFNHPYGYNKDIESAMEEVMKIIS